MINEKLIIPVDCFGIYFSFLILQFFIYWSFLLEFLSDNKVELASAILGRTVDLVEAISPVDTHHTNHREEDADTDTG